MDSVSLLNTVKVFPVSIVRVVFLLLTLMSPSGVRVVLSEVEFADGVAVFRFLVPGYRMLFGTAIAVCVDCRIRELASTLSLKIVMLSVLGTSWVLKL